MEKWEIAARKFVEQCEVYNDMEAVFLTGSYAAGNADKYSDIDLYIVLSDHATWRVRGNKRVDGFSVEYFANPAKQIKKYIDSSYNDVRILEINMILNGIVILNRNATAESLREYCLEKDMNNFQTLGEFSIKMGQYYIWDNFDELTRAYENKSADFTMQYYVFIRNIFDFYSRYICSPVPDYHHLYRWLTDDAYHDKFKLPPYRDITFLDLISRMFDNSDISTMFSRASDLKDYVLSRTEGLNMDDFMLKGPCDC